MRLLLAFLTALSAAIAQQVPKSPCDFDGFDPASKLAEVQTATTAYYACGTGKCLPMTLKQGDPVAIARAEGAWTCGYLAARKGSAQGWVQTMILHEITADPKPPLAAWIGEWRRAGDHIDILATKKRDTVEVEGDATWHGFGGNVHEGSISGDTSPSGNHLHLEDEGCIVDITMIGKYLLANDNNMCGGVNVRFWGIWKRNRTHSNN